MKWENACLYFAVFLGMMILPLVVKYPSGFLSLIESFWGLGALMIRYLHLEGLFQVFQNLSLRWLLVLLSVLELVFGGIIIVLFSEKVELGSRMLFQDTSRILRLGLLFYGMFALLIGVFFYSVVGIPLSLLFFSICCFLVVLGKIPVAVYLGSILLDRFAVEAPVMGYYLLGSFIILLCESVYVIGGAFLFFVYPVVALGILLSLFVQKGEMTTILGEKRFDRAKIRDIITKGNA